MGRSPSLEMYKAEIFITWKLVGGGDPSGMNYAPEETMDAWQKTLAFLEAHLK